MQIFMLGLAAASGWLQEGRRYKVLQEDLRQEALVVAEEEEVKLASPWPTPKLQCRLCPPT